jgi:hypothetical protein
LNEIDKLISYPDNAIFQFEHYDSFGKNDLIGVIKDDPSQTETYLMNHSKRKIAINKTHLTTLC